MQEGQKDAPKISIVILSVSEEFLVFSNQKIKKEDRSD